MNSARGGVLDQGGTCFTTVSGRLTKRTAADERRGEKRIWGEKKRPDEMKDDERAEKGEGKKRRLI